MEEKNMVPESATNHPLWHLIIDAPRDICDDMVKFFKEYKGTKDKPMLNYVIGFEISRKTGKEHFHITFECETPIQSIRRHMVKKFKQINSLKAARILPLVFLYTVKSKDVIACTYDQKYLKEWLKHSYEKPEGGTRKQESTYYQRMLKHILKMDLTSERQIGSAILDYYKDKAKCIPFDRLLKQNIESIYMQLLYSRGTSERCNYEKKKHQILDRILLD